MKAADGSNNKAHDKTSNNNEPEWAKMEAFEDEVLIEATRRYEERLKKKESKQLIYQYNLKLISSLDDVFLKNCYQNFVLWAYTFNLSLIIINYKFLKPYGVKRWKRYPLNTIMFCLGNLGLLRFWLHDYPLDQYNMGKVKVGIIKV
jgi:hypothetical protein